MTFSQTSSAYAETEARFQEQRQGGKSLLRRQRLRRALHTPPARPVVTMRATPQSLAASLQARQSFSVQSRQPALYDRIVKRGDSLKKISKKFF